MRTSINIVNYCSAKKKVRELSDNRFSGAENRTEKLQTVTAKRTCDENMSV